MCLNTAQRDRFSTQNIFPFFIGWSEKICSIAALKKRGSREDDKLKNIRRKNKVYKYEKYPKVQIATSILWKSSLSPQLSVINVSVDFEMSKQKNVNIKIGRFDQFFCVGNFFSLL